MFIIQLLFLQVVLFVGLILVLRKLMSRHATTATTHLQGLSQEYMKKQEELKKRLEDVERRYQQQLAKAQEEGQQLKIRAAQEAEAIKQKVIDEAHQEAERIMDQATKARESLQQELLQSIDSKAVERACELIQGALPPDLQEAIHVQWVDALLKNGLISIERLPGKEEVQEVRVVSAFPLTSAQRAALAQRLKTALGAEVPLQEAVDPRLVAGLTMTIGHLVLDGSLSSKLLEAARHAQHEAGDQ